MNHRPLRIQFLLTSLPVGGAETLLLNLIKKLDHDNFQAEVVCLKDPGELGPSFAELVPVHSHLIHSKWDALVLLRLARLFRHRKTDAVITIGAGDKMFWGRLAARMARVPVICSALHSTGWPDGVGKLNRWLTPITDGFIAVAQDHARFMIEQERFPADKVFMIPNGVDTARFAPDSAQKSWLRSQLGVASHTPLVGIVAAMRPEKNHIQFVQAAKQLLQKHPNTHFVIVGDGPERSRIQSAIDETTHQSHFHLLGSRQDTQSILAGLDLFCLTSLNEANPVSILEALSCGIPVVGPDVGSIRETVIHGQTGFLTQSGQADQTCQSLAILLDNPQLASSMGLRGRALVESSWSLQTMVDGYQQLVHKLYNRWASKYQFAAWQPLATQQALPKSRTCQLMGSA